MTRLADTTAGPAFGSGHSAVSPTDVQASWWPGQQGAFAAYLSQQAEQIRVQLEHATRQAADLGVVIPEQAQQLAQRLAVSLFAHHLVNAFAQVQDLHLHLWASEGGGLIVAAEYPKLARRLTVRLSPDGEARRATVVEGDELLSNVPNPEDLGLSATYAHLVNTR